MGPTYRLFVALALFYICCGNASANSGVQFNYVVLRGEAMGIVRGFEMDGKTALQFRTELGETVVSVLDEANRPIAGVVQVGPYVILPRIYSAAKIRLGSSEALLVRNVAQAPQARQPLAAANGQLPQAPQHPMAMAAPRMALGAPVQQPQALAPQVRQTVWTTSVSDVNLRQLLVRWCSIAERRCEVVWDVERDIPIQGSDQVAGDLRTAVRRALRSTQFGDLKVQPCFYSNDVIRVVRQTTQCKPVE